MVACLLSSHAAWSADAFSANPDSTSIDVGVDGWEEEEGSWNDGEAEGGSSSEARTYTLRYVVDGKILVSYSLTEGTTIEAIPEPKKEGYIFSGWSEIPKTMPAKDVTVTGSFTFDYNTDAYKRLSAQIIEVQKLLDAAKATVETECKDVAANYTATIAEIQKSIDDVKADLEAKYENVELTSESAIDTADITDAIETLLADAAAAQKAYEESVGIGSVYDAGAKVKAIYNMKGQKVKNPVSGKLYIFVYDNGVTVKRAMK